MLSRSGMAWSRNDDPSLDRSHGQGGRNVKALGERLLDLATTLRAEWHNCEPWADLLEEAAREVGLPGMSVEEARTLRKGDRLRVVWCGYMQREHCVPFGTVVTLTTDCRPADGVERAHPEDEADILYCALEDGTECGFTFRDVVRAEVGE
jgi:hypothetical protein